jgi:glycosyltransferase involved in cell wall biosynthesis
MSESKIKILHLIGGDLNGGAARGAYSLHRGLLANGIYSRVLTDSSTNNFDQTVVALANNREGRLKRAVRRWVDTAPSQLYSGRKRNIFSTGFAGYDFTKTKVYAEATIIHLHWVNLGFVSLRHLQKVKKPIVWTLRDMWPMTGGCHYSMECERYIDGCGQCPQLNSTTKFDLSSIVNLVKQKSISRSVKVVGISHWLSAMAQKSLILNRNDIRTISNNIDTADFFPINKEFSRSLLGIPSAKKVVLIGAQSLGEFYKGFDKFLKALPYLNKNDYHLCFFGNLDLASLGEFGYSYSSLGFLHDTITLRIAYSAADVFVAPSVMDAFGKTLAEAMACGTPVVCFDATGPRDIVDHLVNGYRAQPFEPEDLARGIEWVCHHPQSADLARLAREKSVTHFDYIEIAKQYFQLYKEIVDETN